MTRTFIALELSESLQRSLGEMIRRMALELPGLRWVDPARIHLTLSFLGELTNEQLALAMEATELAVQKVSPFSYRLSQAGMFGSPRQPRVLWVGVEEPSGNLQRLHRILNQELERRGFEIDTRPFSPHFTLSRIKTQLTTDELQRLHRLLREPSLAHTAPQYHVQQLSVMKSELARAGAIYTRMREFPLFAQGVAREHYGIDGTIENP